MKNKIIDYKLVTESNSTDLTYEVRSMIENGYQPYGSLVYENDWYIQAMVKYQSDQINVENNVYVINDSSLKYTLERLLGEK